MSVYTQVRDFQEVQVEYIRALESGDPARIAVAREVWEGKVSRLLSRLKRRILWGFYERNQWRHTNPRINAERRERVRRNIAAYRRAAALYGEGAR